MTKGSSDHWCHQLSTLVLKIPPAVYSNHNTSFVVILHFFGFFGVRKIAGRSEALELRSKIMRAFVHCFTNLQILLNHSRELFHIILSNLG